MDINEHTQFDQKWRNTPDFLADILATAMDAIVVVDDAQKIVLFNTAAEKIFNCPASDAIGKSLERFVPERFREAHCTHIQHFANTWSTARKMGRMGMLWGLRTDGAEFPIEARGLYLSDNKR
jgi:PAS domain S-box-containing protein